MIHFQGNSQQGVFDTKSKLYDNHIDKSYKKVNKWFRKMAIPVSTETSDKEFRQLLFGLK